MITGLSRISRSSGIAAHSLGIVIARARRAGRQLAVFHNRRRDADFLALKAVLADGRLGRITHLESHFDRYRPEVRQRWREGGGPGSGLWYDLGPHLLDQALQLFGAAGVVSGHVLEQLYRDVRALRIYEGASEIQQLVIARQLLKERGL